MKKALFVAAAGLCFVLLALFSRSRHSGAPSITTAPTLTVPAPAVPAGAASTVPAVNITNTTASVGAVQLASTPTPTAVAKFNDWAERWLAGDPSIDAVRGEALAWKRRQEMLELIQSDPSQALAQAVPFAWRQRLPGNVARHFERWVDGRGDLYVAMAKRETSGSQHYRWISLRGEQYQAFAVENPLTRRSQKNIPLHGIELDGKVAITGRSIRVVTGEEAEVITLAHGYVATDHCVICEEPLNDQGMFGDIGGEVRWFCCAEHLEMAGASMLLAADHGLGGATLVAGTSTDWTQGRKDVLYMRVNFPDDLTDPYSEASAYSTMDAVNQYYINASYNQIWLNTTVTPVLTLPQVKTWYATAGPFALLQHAREVARKAGYDTDNYHLDILSHTTVPTFDWGGLGFVGAKGTWLQSYGSGVTAHELGHNMGLPHANFWQPFARYTSTYGRGTNIEYGNIFDTMGSGGAGNSHFNAFFKNQLNWLPDTAVHVAGTNGTYRIYPFDTSSRVNGRLYAVSARKDFDRDYWIEFRNRIGGNTALQNGVLLNWDPWEMTGGTELIDTTPQTTSRNDASVVVGRTYSDTLAGVHITPLARGQTGNDPWIDVQVNFDTDAPNIPCCLKVEAQPLAASVGQLVRYHATVSDRDDGNFAYFWSFDDGTFSTNNQPWVYKSWSSQGEHVVRCEVSDLRGGRASANFITTVGSPVGFRVSGVVLDEDGFAVENALIVGTNQTGQVTAFTDSDGVFVLTGLDGSYDIAPVKYGYRFQERGWNSPLSVSSNYLRADFLALQRTNVTLTVTTNVVTENSGAVNQFILTRSGNGSNDLTVELNLSGSANLGSDYSLVPPLAPGTNSVVIPAGTNQLVFTIVPLNNSTVEPTEHVYLTIRDSDDYVIKPRAEAHLTILDDDQPVVPAVSITSLDGPVLENGMNTIGFRVTRTGGAAGSLPVTYTVGGTATAGVDYNALVGTVIIPAGSLNAVVNVAIRDDKDVEPQETIAVTLSASGTYTISSGSASGTILDDDLLVVTVTPTQTGLGEPSSSGRFTVQRDGDQSMNLVVNYSMAGSATSGVDYTSPSGSVTIPAGAASAEVVITALNDATLEGDETVQLLIQTNAAYDIGIPGSATLILRDDELPTVTVTATDADASEPGSDFGEIQLSRGSVTSGDLAVTLTVSGSAVGGADYLPFINPVVISNGTSSATLTIIPFDDLYWEESPETIIAIVATSTNYNVGSPARARVNLVDDENSGTPAVGFTYPTFNALESESPGLAVGLSHTSTAPITVQYQISGGTASPGADYTLAPGTLTFDPGDWAKSIPMPIINDTNPESDETIKVTLFNPQGATHDDIKTITYTIVDDDTSAVSVSATVASASEMGPVAGNFRITRTGGTNNSITVNYQITGTASSPSDFPTIGSSVILGAGVSFVDLPVTPVADATVELDEDVVLTLTSAPTGKIVSPNEAIITIADADTNGLPVVSVASTNQPFAVEGGGGGSFVITRSGPTNAALTVNLTVGGSASSPADYAALPVSVVIPAGQFSTDLTVNAVDDSAVEGDETVIATLTSSPTYRVASPGGAQVTLQDNDQSVRIDAADLEAAEPGANIASFVVTRFGSTNNAVQVFYNLTGNAGNGTDYALLPNSVTIPAGSLTNTVTITPLDDAFVESPETVTLTLQANAAYTLGAVTSASATILDDEPSVTIVASRDSSQEGERAPVLLRVQRGGDPSYEFTARLSVSGTAAYGADYPAFQTNVFFNCGIAAIDLELSPTNELVVENEEAVSVTVLANAAYTRLAPSNAVVSIVDAGTNLAPVVTITSPTTNLVYLLQTNANMILEATITDDGDTNVPVTVTWTNTSGPAPVYFGDIALTNTTVTFSNSGVYVLRLMADDGLLTGYDEVTVVVGALARLTNNAEGAEMLHWAFDEGSGATAGDSSGNNRIGGFEGSPTWTTGVAGGAISLSGAGDLVRTLQDADFLNGQQRLTLTCWINPFSVPDTRGLFAGMENPTNSTLTLATRSAASCGTANNVYEATLSASCGDTKWVSASNAVASGWQHLALTWSNGVAPMLYLNGQLDQSGKHGFPVSGELVECDEFLLGKGPSDLANTWAGLVDELRIFSWPMNQAEVGAFVAANFGPIIEVPTNVTVAVITPVDIGGTATDDGRPNPPGAVTLTWSQIDDLTPVVIPDPSAPTNTLSFDFAGDYLFRLIADDGQVKIYEDLPVKVVEPAQVQVYASDGDAAELGPDTGEFTFTRFGDLDVELTLDFIMSGTASNVSDFVEIATTNHITFSNGMDTVTIPVTPFLDHRTEGDETIIITLQSNLLYTISSGEATVTIHDSPYGQWTVANFTLEQLTDPAQSGEAADFDADRYHNFVEYSANRNPKLGETNALLQTAIELDPNDNQNHITLTYTRRLPPTDTAYEVVVSTNLVTWQSGTNFVREVSATDDGNFLTETVKAQVVAPWPALSPQFVTVRVWLLSTGP